MKKVIKVGFPILCVCIIGGTFIMLGKLEKKVEGSLKVQNETSNITNESIENKTENEAEYSADNEIENDIEKEESDEVTYSVPIE